LLARVTALFLCLGGLWGLAKGRLLFRLRLSVFGQVLGQAVLNEDFKNRGVFGFLSIAGTVGAAVLWGCAYCAEAGRDVYSGYCR
tara:strand:- start:36 stop:290 length:255 start_codon:yes stop_codon:yes gene_type:complete